MYSILKIKSRDTWVTAAKYFRALPWVTVMSKCVVPFSLSCFRAQFDRQVPGWCAKQQHLWIGGAPGNTDSPDISFFLSESFHHSWCKIPMRIVHSENIYILWFCSTRTTCPPEGSHGKICAKRPCRTLGREIIILQVNLLDSTSGSSRTETLFFCISKKRCSYLESVLVRLSCHWKYHHVLLLRHESFRGPRLQIQTEHPFFRTTRSNTIEVLSCSSSSPDLMGLFFVSFTRF